MKGYDLAAKQISCNNFASLSCVLNICLESIFCPEKVCPNYLTRASDKVGPLRKTRKLFPVLLFSRTRVIVSKYRALSSARSALDAHDLCCGKVGLISRKLGCSCMLGFMECVSTYYKYLTILM